MKTSWQGYFTARDRYADFTFAYAIAALAAVGFAGLLVFILRSEEVRGFLLNLIRTALALP